jgi:hypothetical protein
MNIMHIGHSIIHTHDRDIVLKNILHVPQTNKNLMPVHKLTSDNDAFMKLHSAFFFIEDQESKKILLRGRCKDGLYLLESLPPKINKYAFGASITSIERWHSNLGIHRLLLFD